MPAMGVIKHKARRRPANLTAVDLERLDNLLVHTDVPISALAKRFVIASGFLHERLRELGYTVTGLKSSWDYQERVPLAKEEN